MALYDGYLWIVLYGELILGTGHYLSGEGRATIFRLGIVPTTAAPAVNRIRCNNQCFRLIFWLFCN